MTKIATNDTMTYFKTVVMGVSLPEHHEGYSSKHLKANVVLIDQTSVGLESILYQLDKEKIDTDLTLVKNGCVQLPRGAFLMMGHVHSVDRDKKLIYLSPDKTNCHEEITAHTVSYNHLIIARGFETATKNTHQGEEFSIAFQALVDALKVQKNVPLINPWAQYEKKLSSHSAKKSINFDSKELSLQDHFPNPKAALYSIPISQRIKRNFELQL